MNVELQEKIKDLINFGVSSRKIAYQLKISLLEVSQFINNNKLNCSHRVWNKTDPSEIEFIKLAHSYGAAVKTLASSIYHTSPKNVEELLVELGLERNQANIHNYDIDQFNSIDCQYKAYWLGYIFADGANQEKGLNFSVNIDKLDHIRELAKFLGDDPEKIQVKNNYVKYKIYSKELFNKLTNLGSTSPKTNMFFPEIKQELYSHFLRGYLDGKSSLTVSEKSREWRLSISGNLNILNNIIKNSPIDLKISKNSSGYNCIVISGNQRMCKFAEWLYKDATIYYPDRYQKYQELLAQ